MSNILPGALMLTEADRHRLTSELSDVNGMVAAMHALGASILSDNELPAEHGAVAIRNLAMVACRKLDAIARALGDGGFGNFEDEFAPIILWTASHEESTRSPN